MMDAVGVFEDFFEKKLHDELRDLAQNKYPESSRSISVDWNELSRFNSDVADALLEKPDKYSEFAEDAIANLNIETGGGEKFKPHVRFYSLPPTSSVPVKNVGAAQLGKLVQVKGVVQWVTELKPLMQVAEWYCTSCEDVNIKTVSDKSFLRKPSCPKCGREMRLREESSDFINFQRAQVQETVEELRGSAPAARLELWMEDDITNFIMPGEKVLVTGVLRLRPLKNARGKSSIYEKFLDAVHLQKVEEQFETLKVSKEEKKDIQALAKDPQIYEKIVKSIAPSIHGFDELKQAIALQLFGGTPNKVQADGEVIRPDMHLLLIGDPGTGKSSILEYVSRLAPKSVTVSGGGTSGVGLTASAEKDTLGEGWILKAGAMVLANGGIAIIDEFDKMDEGDRGSIHQAMEQQKINIAKAGIVTEFKSQTAVLAAANPKMGRFDANKLPAEQFNISPALLSRFDLIFTVRDVLDESKDRELASHILASHKYASHGEVPPEDSPLIPAIPLDLLRKYVAYARKTCFPVLTDDAVNKIRDYYVKMRKTGKDSSTFPITARQIEGIIRLAEASAKMRLSEKVLAQDAERAIALEEYVLELVFLDKETGLFDSDIINIGKPKSQVDQIRNVMDIVRMLGEQKDLVEVEEIKRKAADYGIKEEKVEKYLADLKNQGEIYEPKYGFVRNARKY